MKQFKTFKATFPKQVLKQAKAYRNSPQFDTERKTSKDLVSKQTYEMEERPQRHVASRTQSPF